MNTPSLLRRASTTWSAATLLALASAPAPFTRAAAILPDPADTATGVAAEATLAWSPGPSDPAATGYRVVLGVGDPASGFVVNTETLAAASGRVAWTPPPNVIQTGTRFWWRVDTLTSGGEVAGAVWRFTTRAETESERDARMAWFREGKFFGAIVWGLYSGAEGVWPPQTGTKGGSWTYAEWMQYWKSLPSLTYRDALEPCLTGVNFDAGAMARLCKQAGMEMVYVMPRHHDGYAIWDTATTTTLAPAGFKITNSPHNPTRRDYLKELVDALRAEGLRVGFYFSLGDWHHPDFPRDGSWAHPQQGQTVPGADWSRYVEYLYQQVREIVDPAAGAGYGPFDAVYFDYSSDGINGEEWGASRLVHLVRRHQPGIIINNRLWNGLENPNGDFATPEATIDHLGYNQVHRDWEAIMSANSPPTWGYGRPDLYPFKSGAALVRDIVSAVAKGGTIELSVSPKGDGGLHADQVRQYRQLGSWMARNGAAVKGSRANPVGVKPSWGEITCRPAESLLYLHVFDRPADGVIATRCLPGAARRAWLLAEPARTLPVTTLPNGFQVTLPAAWADATNTVIAVDCAFPGFQLRSATVAAVSSENVIGLDRDASRTVDSSGLSAGLVGLEHAEGESALAWTSVGSIGPGVDYDPCITFDLGEICDVRAIREWGYNAALPTFGTAISKIGPKTVDVYGSADGVTFALAGQVRFARAPGVAGYLGNTVALDAPGVRYLKLDIRENHDGAVFDGTGARRGGDGRSLTGLSEIRFVTGPPGAHLRLPYNRPEGASFRFRAEGLDLGKTYRLTRSLLLPWNAPVVLEGPRPPQATIDDFTDPAPPGRAYYRVEETP